MNEEGCATAYDRWTSRSASGIQGGLDLVNIVLDCSSDNVCGGV